jgi:glucans biosynthesis protein
MAILNLDLLTATQISRSLNNCIGIRIPLQRMLATFICLIPTLVQANGRFQFDDVAALAKKSAAEAFRPPQLIPEFLRALSYDDYRDIRFDTKRSWWRDGGNFQVQFIHPGLFYGHAVKMNTVDGGVVRPASFSPEQFTYGRNKFTDKIPADLGFAGFRITYPFYPKSEFNHVVVFAGASYFRAVAKGQVFGLSARGLAIDTGLPTGEEFPYFKEFWLERPARDARQTTLYALLDSASVTGAYSFVIQPGEQTVVTVRMRLFLRKPVKELGVAPLTSMFLYGEDKPRPADDWRPEVHDSDGLLVHSGAGEWLWRPLGNPEKLRISYFEFDNPRGFGLLQRDRQLHNYEDLETRQELRPNAWITPIGNWGKGQVKLVEIPSRKEANDNIVAYWLPRAAPPVGQALDFAYRIDFQSADPVDVNAGRVTAMRIGIGDKEEWKRFVIDFEGQKLRSLGNATPVKAIIDVGSDGQLVQQSVSRNPVNGGWRVSFQVKPPKGKPLELRAFLQHGNRAVSETWSYQLES